MFSFKVHRSLIRLGLLPCHPPPPPQPLPSVAPRGTCGARGPGYPWQWYSSSAGSGPPAQGRPPPRDKATPPLCVGGGRGKWGCQQRDRRLLAPPVHRPPAPVGPRRRAPDPSQTLGLFIVFDVVRRTKKGTQYQSRTIAGIDENHHFS